ncbi:MAG: hypothetical protein CBC49_009705 [Alphaproteobacteria bacterium TMED89]|nr:MAG: hypothetical protein CBC49_009705 [Alphaproteobacteria bacterium TMED89]
MTAQDTENAQLPVGQIWREAYGFVFSVPLRVVLTALIPLGLYSLAATWIQVQFLNQAVTEMFAASDQLSSLSAEASEDEFFAGMSTVFEAGAGMFQWIVIMLLLGGLASATMAAAWHRTTLIGLDAERTGLGLHFGRTELSYFYRALVMVLLTTLAVVGFAIVVGILTGVIAAILPGVAAIFTIPTTVLLVLLWLYLWARLILCLPAAALGIFDFGIRSAWSATRGHAGRLMLIYAGLLLPVSIVGILFDSGLSRILFQDAADPVMLDTSQWNLKAWVALVPTFIVTAFTTALVASGISYTYYRLGKPPSWVEKVS